MIHKMALRIIAISRIFSQNPLLMRALNWAFPMTPSFACATYALLWVP
jgi:hypothetical protein